MTQSNGSTLTFDVWERPSCGYLDVGCRAAGRCWQFRVSAVRGFVG